MSTRLNNHGKATQDALKVARHKNQASRALHNPDQALVKTDHLLIVAADLNKDSPCAMVIGHKENQVNSRAAVVTIPGLQLSLANSFLPAATTERSMKIGNNNLPVELIPVGRNRVIAKTRKLVEQPDPKQLNIPTL
jgi:hypothetical protein